MGDKLAPDIAILFKNRVSTLKNKRDKDHENSRSLLPPVAEGVLSVVAAAAGAALTLKRSRLEARELISADSSG